MQAVDARGVVCTAPTTFILECLLLDVDGVVAVATVVRCKRSVSVKRSSSASAKRMRSSAGGSSAPTTAMQMVRKALPSQVTALQTSKYIGRL